MGEKLYHLTPEEEEDLTKYLEIGMSLYDARSQHQKEVEVAKMSEKIRENVRMNIRGSVETAWRTHIGPTTSTRGADRGGRSFN